MKYFTTNQLRRMFLDFFATKEHMIVPSASLIPEDDPSVLLTPAGMAPLKKYFTGAVIPPNRRMVSSQKCIRINDLENVGRTARHLTFFEMLGNFSFADYFKRESLAWGMEFLLEWLEMPIDKLWATIYLEDDEAYDIWLNELNMPPERIVRLGKEHNFWEHGLGPCGPCSEIYIDRGESFGCGEPDCKPGCDCDRYMEFWNHVFTQFNKNADGSYTSLVNKNIDTGMGLERLAVITQQVNNVFETDTMAHIIASIEERTGASYGKHPEVDRYIRIITDHIRSITFLIGDGVIPSNEGRGYILRKLLRRASLQMRNLGAEKPMLDQLALTVIDIFGEGYPLIIERKDVITSMIQLEEDKFHQTLRKGLQYLEDILAQTEGPELSGEQAFRLYDTYGFPLELTEDLLNEHGKTVDTAGFELQMEIQRETARASLDRDSAWTGDIESLLHHIPATEFVGYDNMTDSTKILAMVKDGILVDKATAGDELVLILESTPFYATGGGQVHDTGLINADDTLFTVTGVERKQNLIYHVGTLDSGQLQTDQTVTAEVSLRQRRMTQANHSATHLLHRALNQVLGDSAQQAGSMVDSERLRFDFTYFKALTTEELQQIEQYVNHEIQAGLPVSWQVLPIEEAKKTGAKMLFTEKYGSDVRVITMGHSSELCGGTHVSNTSEIGLFKILSERSIASGVRRIEAVSGPRALEYLNKFQDQVRQASHLLKTDPDGFSGRLDQLIQERDELRKENGRLKDQLSRDKMKSVSREFVEQSGIHLYTLSFEGLSQDELKNMADNILAEDPLAFSLLISNTGDKLALVASSSEKAQQAGYKAGKIISAVARELGGGGGGRDSFASAGARDINKLEGFMATVAEFVQKSV